MVHRSRQNAQRDLPLSPRSPGQQAGGLLGQASCWPTIRRPEPRKTLAFFNAIFDLRNTVNLGTYPASVLHGQPGPGDRRADGEGRGVLGVVDGASPLGVETDADIAWRKDLLRKIGYKL
jgi:hypothetical protein